MSGIAFCRPRAADDTEENEIGAGRDVPLGLLKQVSSAINCKKAAQASLLQLQDLQRQAKTGDLVNGN